MESVGSLGSVGSASSVGPRFALNITALQAKIGSVVPTALIFIFALRAKMSLCMESVESGCLEVGWALRLKLGQVQIPSGPHTVLRTTYAFESPRAEGLLKI